MQHHDNNYKRQAAVGVSECGVSEGRDRWGVRKSSETVRETQSESARGGQGPSRADSRDLKQPGRQRLGEREDEAGHVRVASA
jgi:hypothetical protein